MQPWSPHKYRLEGRRRGVPDQVLDAAIAARERVYAVSPDITPVLTLAHLAQLTNVPYQYLRSVVSRNSGHHYFTFWIEKRRQRKGNRASREISVPSRPLRWVQTWIHDNILSGVPVSSQSYAYHRGSTIMACAQRHAGARWLVKIDIRSFFPSINEHQIYAVFRSLGFGALISFEMARICTRVPLSTKLQWQYDRRPMGSGIPGYESYFAGGLPIGAPTSPALSNLYMRPFDVAMQAFCISQGITYTRYADDLIFSTERVTFDRRAASRLIAHCRAALRDHGLRANDRKTSVVPPGARKIVLGLVVNDEQPRLSREFKALIRQHYHYLTLYGADEHAGKRRFRSGGVSSVPALKRHLEGLLAFAAQVEPAYAHRVAAKHIEIDWPNI